MDRSGTDVLVVGAGPTGLTMGSELQRRGLRTRLIDKAAAPTTLSKAIAVHARTLEIFDDMGIADEAIARGVALRGATLWSHESTLATVDFDDLETRFPFVLSVSQAETEALLASHLAARGGTVERSATLLRLEERGDRVHAWVAHARGEEEEIVASWVVGCDGAHSVVRKAIGGSFEGHTYEDVFLLADVRLAMDLPSDRITTFFAEEGIVACFPMREGRFRIVATATPDVVKGAEPTLAGLREATERRAGRPAPMSDATWLASFRIHCRQVDRYRRGRVFLAGDAAHIHSPAGGQGMNTGIQDAHNLAWKLSLAHRGKATPALLESYQAERHAVGKALLSATDIATKVGTLRGTIATSVRDQVMAFATSFEPVRAHIASQLSELTVGYDGSPIVGEKAWPLWNARLGALDASETPTFGSALAFRSGPRPGMRAPEGRVRAAGTRHGELEPMSPFSRFLRGDNFTLLLFDGQSPSAEGYARLTSLVQDVDRRWGIPSHVITRVADRPSELPADVSLLFDIEGDLERRYAASSECLYLIRPDLYVGFRSQPAEPGALEAHLKTLLVSSVR